MAISRAYSSGAVEKRIRPVNIRDLARHLDVSIGTVSRALNGKSDVNAETRRRVLEAADTLGYSPNQSGRSLRQGTTGMVALMLPTTRAMPLADTIFMQVLEGLRAFLGERSLDLMVLLCGPEENAYAYLRRVVARRIADGLIIADTQRIDPRIDFLLESRIPFVAFGRSTSGGSHPWIDLDFEYVAEFAIDRFVATGHRRIAVATTADEINYGYVFADAYRSALTRRGMPVDPDLVLPVENSEAGGYALGQRILAMADRPTAVVLVNGVMATGLYRLLVERGLEPGRDLSIISFLEERGLLLSPKVTCFRSDVPGLGARLGEALLATMPAHAAHPEAPVIQELWPLQLVPGESDGQGVGGTEP